MAAGLPQVRAGYVGGDYRLVASLVVPVAAVVLDDAAHRSPFGVPHRQPRSQLGGPRQKVELSGQAAVVALFRLGQPVQVGG